MKYILNIICCGIAIIYSISGFSQESYFNNSYNLCGVYDPEAWSIADGIIEQHDGYVICGATVDTVNFWMRRIPLMKIGFDGEIIWKKDFGDSENDYYTGRPGSFKKLYNKSKYFISGTKNLWNPQNYAVGYLMAFDSNFDTIFTRTYNLNLDQIPDTNANFEQMDICSNGDLIFGGSMNGSDLLLWLTDSIGNTRWYKTFHYETNTLCTGYSVIQTSDNGFALGGFMYTIGQPETGNAVIVKTDSLGNQEWVKLLGGPYMDNKAMLSHSPDGNIVMGTAYGEAMSGNNPISRIYITKLDNVGNIIWQHKYAESQMYNFLINIRALEDGSVIACGSTYEVPNYYGWFLKVDMNGDSIWYRKKRYLTGENSLHYLNDIIPTTDNGFITCGDVIPIYPDTGIRSAWVIKLDSIGCDSAGCDTTVGISEEHGGMGAGGHGDINIWPNPAVDWIALSLPDNISSGIVELVVYNIFGQEVMKSSVSPQNRTVSLNVSDLPSGFYLAVCKDAKRKVFKGKFIIAQ